MKDHHGNAGTDSQSINSGSYNTPCGNQYSCQMALEHMPIGVILVNRSGSIIYANRYAAMMSGHSVTDLLQGSWLSHPNNSTLTNLISRVIDEDFHCEDYVTPLIKADGDTLWTSVSCRSIPDADGSEEVIEMVFQDVTARHLAEEALMESEQKYRCIVENSQDTIMINYPNGVISYFSPSCFQLLGYRPEELVGTVPVVVHPDDMAIAYSLFTKALAGESGADAEYRILTKDGDVKWISHSWSPVLSNGELQTIVSVMKDITARRQAEEELRKAYAMQTAFLNNITHEVRTPLTAVQGYVQMLMEGTVGPVSDEQADLLKRVLTSSDHLLSIVSGVLEIARMKTGTVRLQPRVTSPCQIVEKAISAITPQARNKGLYLNIETPEKHHPGVYDEHKLTIILTNLLTNAVKFTDTGGIDVRVHCATHGTEIVVSDTGHGIEQHDIGSIFEEFTQLDYPKKHKPAGFGIGLAIVAAMVEAINGTLVVSSELGVGTAFTLYSPTLEDPN